jgi:hypothetical protein
MEIIKIGLIFYNLNFLNQFNIMESLKEEMKLLISPPIIV